jgi:alcohol dehydrogenase class IV
VSTHLIGDMARAVALPYVKRAAGLVTRFIPLPQPMLLVGPGAALRLAETVGRAGHRGVLLVADAQVLRLGLAAPLIEALQRSGTPCTVFDGVGADAPIAQIEAGIQVFEQSDCDALVALGGGSVIDAAKTIALACTNQKHPRELAGYFKGLRAPAPLYAVPTTAGTGSEVTVAAVIADPEHRCKLVIADTRIVPSIAALDPAMTAGLPRAITAATGMDALTHAVEAFIGDWSTEKSDRMALAAMAMVFEHLPRAYDHGDDLAAREQMALAATYAGMAFTRANVGNVHAIAHQLGAWYHTPHGLANAIMLPGVLRFSLDAAAPRLATLAMRAGLGRAGDDEAMLARRFVSGVESLNRRLGIPRQLDALRAQDVRALAEAACAEADGNYPVPRVMSRADCEALLRKVLPRARQKTARRAPGIARKRPSHPAA